MLSPGRPTLLVLDDLQWCDSETIAWLTLPPRCLRRRPADAARSPSGPRRSARTASSPARFGASAARSASWTSSLRPLDAASTVQLAASLLGRTILPADEELSVRRDGRLPAVRVEAVQTEPPSPAPATGTLPDLGGVLRRRLEEVSPEARDVARLAAAIGSDFSLDLLLEASDLDSVALVDAVDELWHRRIFVERHGRYDFSHDLLRDAAYASVSTARRWLLHRRVAQGLELAPPRAPGGGRLPARRAVPARRTAGSRADVLSPGGGPGERRVRERRGDPPAARGASS